MTALELPTVELRSLARACADTTRDDGIDALVERINEVLPDLRFSQVLTRGGWHRLGGVVDGDYVRVADKLDQWAVQESGGDVAELLDRFADAGYFATRWQGRTHYLTAPLGKAAKDFMQLEIEELQEVLDRFLIDPDWYPDDLEEFIDPLDYPRVQPEPVGAVRYVFRRMVRVPEWLDEGRSTSATDSGGGLSRLFDDWERSSASDAQPFCRHWVLALRETPERGGGSRLSGRPVPAKSGDPLPALDPGLRGAPLANALQHFDHAAGYPFAWYFHMLATTAVTFEVADAVLADLAEGFEYLPARDAEVLRRWAQTRYAP